MSTPDLVVTLEPVPIVRVGYPAFVGVTIHNPQPRRTYYALPEIDRFEVPPPIELVVTPDGADEGETLPVAAIGVGEDPPQGMRMNPGDTRTLLLDMSELQPTLRAGRYRLGGRYVVRPFSVQADPVAFEVEEPAADEAAAVAALRAHNRPNAPSWNAFLLDNFREVAPDELDDIGPKGRAHLAIVLAIHRSTYGPDPIDHLDPALFRNLGDGPLSGESAVLEHELMGARKDPAAATLDANIRAKWPALAWRLDDNAKGQGLLARLRRMVGAERTFPAVPSPLPYSGAGP